MQARKKEKKKDSTAQTTDTGEFPLHFPRSIVGSLTSPALGSQKLEGEAHSNMDSVFPLRVQKSAHLESLHEQNKMSK